MILLTRVSQAAFPLCLSRTRVLLEIVWNPPAHSPLYMLRTEPPLVRVAYNDGRSAALADAMDRDGEVGIVTSLATTDALLLGSLSLYRISARSPDARCVRLYRSFSLAEYWYVRYFASDYGMLVEYDHGLLVLADTLDVVWHARKELLDRVVQIDGDYVVLRTDKERVYSLSLATGERE